jgi:hypothetical protein
MNKMVYTEKLHALATPATKKTMLITNESFAKTGKRRNARQADIHCFHFALLNTAINQ